MRSRLCDLVTRFRQRKLRQREVTAGMGADRDERIGCQPAYFVPGHHQGGAKTARVEARRLAKLGNKGTGMYAAFAGYAVEAAVIDIDHWRHFYLLLAPWSGACWPSTPGGVALHAASICGGFASSPVLRGGAQATLRPVGADLDLVAATLELLDRALRQPCFHR
jgi:hypothetical protein